MGSQLQEAEFILTEEEDNDMPIESSPPCGQELLAENYPQAVLFSGVGIKKWHGCKGEIVWKMYPSPKDFAFCTKALHFWKDPETLEW